MFELTTTEKLDAILKFCVDNNNSAWQEKHLRKTLFPNLNRDEVIVLLKMIDNSGKNVLNINFDSFGTLINANGLTKGFLEQGGFLRIEKSELIQLEKQQDKENLEFKKSKIDLELAEKMLKEYPKTKWFARIGFFIGIGLALLELGKLLLELLSND